jgi:hypothetical protein
MFARGLGRIFSIRIDFITALPDCFGVMLVAFLLIATTYRWVPLVPDRAGARDPTTRLFDTGTISRYFSFMGSHSPGYPPASIQRINRSPKRFLSLSILNLLRQLLLWKLWPIRPYTPMPRSTSN